MLSPRWSDETVDHWIGAILQAGVVTAGALVLLGGILYLVPNAWLPADYRVFSREPGQVHSLGLILSTAAHWDGRAIIQLGILALIATPVMRVVFSVVAFAVQRDRLYVCITLIVLSTLLYGIFGAAH